MRVASSPASTLYHPLDTALGRPAALRVLRVLCVHGGELSTTSLAARAGLTRAGAWQALTKLVELGVVEVVGQGRAVSYRLNRRHPLARPLEELFLAEAARVDSLFEHVRQMAEEFEPQPRAVWLLGSVARHQDRADSDVDLIVVGSHAAVRRQAEVLRESLLKLTADWAVRPSVISITSEDARRHLAEDSRFWRNLERDAVVLFGCTPREVLHG
ncbi:MAG: nucleotidyltransferase domain-containing protein [Gemmatimonadetes bacterium]|nr:nucleotidyltransferase domain-containing protein [Gemmatimonadota bacterium]